MSEQTSLEAEVANIRDATGQLRDRLRRLVAPADARLFADDLDAASHYLSSARLKLSNALITGLPVRAQDRDQDHAK